MRQRLQKILGELINNFLVNEAILPANKTINVKKYANRGNGNITSILPNTHCCHENCWRWRTCSHKQSSTQIHCSPQPDFSLLGGKSGL